MQSINIQPTNIGSANNETPAISSFAISDDAANNKNFKLTEEQINSMGQLGLMTEQQVGVSLLELGKLAKIKAELLQLSRNQPPTTGKWADFISKQAANQENDKSL